MQKMNYKDVLFDAVVATPGSGKSYLCDKYPEIFVDADEVRLRTKYFVPEGITRAELEETKGNRSFEKRFGGDDFLRELNKKLLQEVNLGKVLICSPHPELISFLRQNNLKFCLVYQSKDMYEELKNRMISRGNNKKFIDENCKLFDEYYIKNTTEKDSAVRYEFGHGEYLENIIRDHFGFKF